MSDHADFLSDSWRCRWSCPEPRPLSPAQHAAFVEIVSTMPCANERSANGVDCIGVELRLSMLLVGDAPVVVGGADNDYWDKKCRLLFLRPAIEPVALSYWGRLTGLDLDVDRAQKIVSALTAKEQVLRTREGVGRSANGNVGFELPERASGWLDRLRAARARPELASFMPAFAFASTVMAHPFADGNGRLARLLVLAALADFAHWQGPVIGLAPSFYRHAEALGMALDGLTRTGEWDVYIHVFLEILRDIKYLMASSLLPRE